MILNKQVLAKLEAQPLIVKLWNGNFNKVEVSCSVNRRVYHIEVYDAHPIVHQYVCSDAKENKVNLWYNHSLWNMNGREIPKELEPLIEKMKEKCKMSIDQAMNVRQDMQRVVKSFYEEFYGVQV